MKKKIFSVPLYLFSSNEMALLLTPLCIEKVLLIIGRGKKRIEILQSLKTEFSIASNSSHFFKPHICLFFRNVLMISSIFFATPRQSWSLSLLYCCLFLILFCGAFSHCWTIIQFCISEVSNFIWWYHHHHHHHHPSLSFHLHYHLTIANSFEC